MAREMAGVATLCEDRIGTGPPRARTEVIYVDLGYWAISGFHEWSDLALGVGLDEEVELALPHWRLQSRLHVHALRPTSVFF